MAATTTNAKTPTRSEPLTTTAARATKKLHVKYAPFNRDRAPMPPSFRKKERTPWVTKVSEERRPTTGLKSVMFWSKWVGHFSLTNSVVSRNNVCQASFNPLRRKRLPTIPVLR
jgi:hypothetical protein